MNEKTLTVVIPAFNEQKFIGELLKKVLAVDLSRLGLRKEIIVIDDCSTDRTREIARKVAGVTVITQDRNSGKGKAVRKGIEVAKGDYLIIQDADLEYDPEDYVPMLDALVGGAADAVYGSRYLGSHPQRFVNLRGAKHPEQSWTAYLGGRSLSLVAWVFTRHWVSDTVTALKLFTRAAIKSIELDSDGFELDHEITAKILANNLTILEVPISYFPRSKLEGKKIGLKDWFIAIRTFARYGNRSAIVQS